MIAVLTVRAVQLVALVAVAFAGWRVLRSLDSMSGTLASILRSLAEINAGLGALEAKPNGADLRAHLMSDRRGQTLEN